ncbi:MAG: hypothetical protein WC848_00675 [Parcubacteria group bacterium]|jgi:hypothetical protein
MQQAKRDDTGCCIGEIKAVMPGDILTLFPSGDILFLRGCYGIAIPESGVMPENGIWTEKSVSSLIAFIIDEFGLAVERTEKKSLISPGNNVYYRFMR